MNLFLDGCSHYNTAQLGTKYTTVTSDNCSWSVDLSGGPGGNGAITKTASNNTQIASGYLGVSPLVTQSGAYSAAVGGVFGCRLKIADLSALSGFLHTGGPQVGGLINLMNGSASLLSLLPNTDGTLSPYRWRSGVSGYSLNLGTSLTALQSGQWAYLEMKWLLSQSGDGVIIVRANGNTIFTFTGRTSPDAGDSFPFQTPAPLMTSVQLMNMTSAVSPLLQATVTDIYLNDSIAPNDDFFGDGFVGVVKPTGAGASTQWTPSSGANWSCVDEIPPSDDGDYIETATADNQDLYTFEVIANDPKAVQVCAYARKTGEGGASLAATLRQSSTDYPLVSQAVPNTTYVFLRQPIDTNPATGTAWTTAAFNAGQAGPKKTV